MKLSALIVDDEPLMRIGIEMAIDWACYGIHEVLTAPNGRVALQMIEQQPPDILLTDVRMPGIDGLELSRIVKERWSRVKVVIISGYDDFSYAKKCISYGVTDYILKPIDGKTLSTAIEKIVHEIQEEHQKLQEQAAMSQRLNQTFGIARQKVLKDILFGDAASLELQRYSKLLGLEHALQGGVAVALVKIHSFREKSTVFRDGGLLHFAVQNILEELLRIHQLGELVDVRLGSLCLLLRPEDHAILEQFVNQALKAISETIRVQTAWGISGINEGGVSGMRRCYEEAARALKLRLLYPDTRMFQTGGVSELKSLPLPGAESLKSLYQALALGNVQPFQALLDSAFKELASGGPYDPDSIEAYYLEMAGILETVHRDRGSERSDFLEQVREAHYFCDTLQDVLERMNDIFQTAFLELQSQFRKPYSKVIRDVIDYLNANFKRDISLADAAGHVYLNRSYLSHLFGQETGSNFSDFLTELRIEKAKELFRSTTLKNYEIADEVGYRDFRHFGQIFKKHTGMTPSEYRKVVP
ncbi:response regulator [Paenibacillus cremeus]|uniref:Response regulator transcription factor n=1 Tax=Paenibacillus cremeus TaxID=2163881 RepID=A0A559KG70_9BACL|nr:response regulator [Paenibacillus cremeus]TVY11112.1 response regulator transcription factor [Paenibacillus cremeus]